MKPSISAKLAQLAARLDEVNHLLSSEEATRDMDAFRKLNRERSELEPVVDKAGTVHRLDRGPDRKLEPREPFREHPQPVDIRSRRRLRHRLPRTAH